MQMVRPMMMGMVRPGGPMMVPQPMFMGRPPAPMFMQQQQHPGTGPPLKIPDVGFFFNYSFKEIGVLKT